MSAKIDIVESNSSTRELAGVATRYAIYSSVLFGLLLLFPVIARRDPGKAFEEDGVIEWFQTGTVAAAALLFAWGAVRYISCRPLLTVLATVASIAVVRESDSLLSQIFPIVQWPGVAAVVILTGFTLVWRRRDEFLKQTSLFASTAGFSLLWGGFVAIVAFAQLAGDHRIWQLFLAADIERPTRRAIQELCEAFGYFLLLVGAVEGVLWARDVASESSAEALPVTRIDVAKAGHEQRIERRAA